MPPTIINSKASNWVDRGEPPHPTITRILGRFLDRHPGTAPAWFQEQAETIVGMVAADATEVHVASFLRTLLTADSPWRSSGQRADAGLAESLARESVAHA